MSENYTDIEYIASEDAALRRIFLECLASSTSSASISSFSSLPSTASEVDADTLVDYIRDNASGNYRNKALLDELQKSIEEVVLDGRINWPLFKKASRQWIVKVVEKRQQDSNNNMASDYSGDGSIGRSDDEKRVSGDGGESDHEIGNLEDPCRKRPKTPRRFVTAGFINLSNVSSYSPDSDAIHGCGISDCTPESADETDVGVGFGEAGHIDLRLRVRRFDEENALLREELVRTEELVSELERKSEHLRYKLDQTNERCHQLQRENEEYREILSEVEAKERDCRLVLQKVEKQRESLARNLENAEAERHQINNLTSMLEKCKKEKLDGIKQATRCRQDLESKQNECEMLREKLMQLEEVNETLTKSYEKTIRHLREKNDELRTQVFDLQIERSVDTPSDIICSTPPTSYLHSYMQSTPCNNRKDLQLQDSLYSELKASGFSVEETANESKIRDLQDEITWYNEEIRDAVTQIDNILELIELHRRTPHVPVLNLDKSPIVKTADIYELLQKLAGLSNKVNEIIRKPKVKDACSQICSTQDDERICRQYGIPSFDDSLRFAREKPESATEVTEEADKEGKKYDVFVEAFSMNSRLLGEYVEELEIAEKTESQRETKALSPEDKGSMSAPLGVQERTIIDPIVEEIDKILQCTNKCEEESPSKNPRYRCIYTCAQPSTDFISLDNSVTDLTVNSPKRLESKFAATYVIASGGDTPCVGMVNHSNTNGENSQDQSELMVKINSHEESNTFDATSVSESMVESNFEETKLLENETLAEESIDSKLRDTKFDHLNPDSFLASSTFAEPKVSNLFSVGKAEPRNGTTYCVTPNASNRKLPKRKISVYGRSFDVATQQCGDEGEGSSTYRLMERSISSPEDSEQTKRIDATMALDLNSMKQLSKSKNFPLHTYRTNNNDSDSSGPPSPEKPLGLRQEDSSLGEVVNRSRPRKLVLAPTKLKLPLLKEIPAYAGVEKSTNKNSTVDADKEKEKIMDSDDAKSVDKDMTVNETQKTYDLSNVEASKIDSTATQVSSIDEEMIRPGDEIERGITYRRPFSRDSDCSAYSLLSPLEDSGGDDNTDREKVDNVSTVVMSDDESTSCDSSPKREVPVAQSTLKHSLVSTYEKPGDRNYSRPDPSKTGGSRHVERLSELCYQMRNDSTSGVGSYSSGGGNGGIRSSVEKASVVPAVALAMSSGEDTSDSECDPMAIRDDDERRNIVDETRSISPTVRPFADGAVLSSSTPAPIPIAKTDIADVRGDCGPWNPMAQKRDKKERVYPIRRSLSEGGCGKSDCSCYRCNPSKSTTETTEEEMRPTAFPSLTDTRLQESGIANLSSTDELGGNLTEADLERKCTAFSVGLVTDRVTLPCRLALSVRQRDQSERNLASEVLKMQQDIQDLAPLCIDRESVERVERVRHQLEMINQCAHRVSCTAETLGAVHQENRVSRAVLLADRYLLVLRSRCEKLTSDLAETKRILTENNIVFEETNGELGDDMPRIRYRGMPTNNRTMMARRRASIATIFRPLGPFQDVTKDGVRQRNSVSGRVTLRRPSLSAESQKWEADKLDRTDSSSSSIGELREIFEQAESRRASREENNNVLRLHSSNHNVREGEHEDDDVWTNLREEPVAELPAIVDGCQETRLGRRTSLSFLLTTKNQVPWKLMFWCIIISFIFGFYMKHVVSSVNKCSGTPSKWWSLEELLERYVNGKNDAATPI